MQMVETLFLAKKTYSTICDNGLLAYFTSGCCGCSGTMNKIPYTRAARSYPYFLLPGQKKALQKSHVPTGGLEPPIFGLGDRRLIH